MNFLDGKKTYIAISLGLFVQVLEFFSIDLSGEEMAFLQANWDTVVTTICLLAAAVGRKVAKPKEATA